MPGKAYFTRPTMTTNRRPTVTAVEEPRPTERHAHVKDMLFLVCAVMQAVAALIQVWPH